ncbi:MAG: DUF434 domain-containing protein [Acidobacteriota bacterium]
MPDRRRHRGAHPQDRECFAARSLETLRQATDDLCWLRSRGYSDKAAVALVGDRYQLRLRQRSALQRCAVSESARDERRAREVEPEAVHDRPLWLDGYNVLLTVEAALGGGVVLQGRDGAFRDMAAMRSHFRRVNQTRPALRLIGSYLIEIGCCQACWYFDRPISNSGRLKAAMLELAEAEGWPWQVELVPNPDKILAVATEIIATADGGILDAGPAWLNLARRVVEAAVPSAWVVAL